MRTAAWVLPRLAVLAAVAALGGFGGAAHAAPGLFVGVADDTLIATPAETSAVARDLGLRAFSLSLRWSAGETALSASAAGALGTATRAAAGAFRVVVYVYGDYPPASPAWREQYCSYVRDLLVRFPQVNDVVIWNEPNLTYFWSPQFDPGGGSLAPVQYEALLERCYDVLHSVRPGVNVIAPAASPWGNDDPFAASNVSHSPTSFILQLGRAYRASGRSRPIFDTLGHHPHPVSSNERPWLVHSDARFVTVGDLDRLVGAVTEAFGGTAQPVPGQGLPIWYLETGYQTVPDPAKRALYTGIENWPGALPADAGGDPAQPPPDATSAAPDQATQLADTLRLAYCQPYVQAVFNFQLRDESILGGWQSGVLWADGTRKGSYDTFRRVAAEVHDRAVDCSQLKGSVWKTQPAGKAGGAGTQPGSARPASRGGRRSVDTRRPTRIVWTARSPAPFGYVRLAARLTERGRPLLGHQVTFGLGGTLLLTTTSRGGVARVPLGRPLPPGAHMVTVSFRGSRELAPAALKLLVRVRNSRATLATAGVRGRSLAAARGTFRIRSTGRAVAGTLRLRVGSRVVVARRLNALGVAADGSSAWFAGTARGGKRIVGRVSRTARRGGDTLRLWVAGKPLPLVRGLDVRLRRPAR